MATLMYCPCGTPIWVTYQWGNNGYQHLYLTDANNDQINACPSCGQDAATWVQAGDNRLELSGILQPDKPQESNLLTLPHMTLRAAQLLHSSGIPNRASLHENIQYEARTVAYIAEVSLTTVELWLANLEKHP